MTTDPSWLLLIYSIPPKPDYLRVKVRRRLRRIGAAALKPSVYVRRNDAEGREDFTWLAREIEADGGTAILCAAELIDGVSDADVRRLLRGEKHPPVPRAIAIGPDRVKPGRTWVTRKGVFVDRIASAWLIRNHIDPDARFKFVGERGYRPRPGELRFDMLNGEYTHLGGACTFERLLERFTLRDRGLALISQIVHDIDCKDNKFRRPEAPGVALLLRGIAQPDVSDRARLEHGARLLDDLYAELSRSRQGRAEGTRSKRPSSS